MSSKNAIFGMVIPDVLTSSQTWALTDKDEAYILLDNVTRQLYPFARPVNRDRDDEWSGSGVYRLQIRLNRPEGRPLYSLKWEGPL